jgi:hypothetical protein
LNEPHEAESICHDILGVDSTNHDATVMLILSLSDQLSERMAAFEEAWGYLEELDSEYERNYYSGVLCERRARAHFRKNSMGSGHVAYDWFQEALEYFDEAATVRPKGNDKSYLRWNAVIRTLEAHSSLAPDPENSEPQLLE